MAAKSDIPFNGKKLISVGDVYVRSLRSNNTPSTTKAGWKDWPKIIEVCFDNREADIGRFMRRHLSGITPKVLRELVSATTKGIEEAPTEDLLRRYLQESEERYNQVIQERGVKLPDHGVWEVALLLVGDVPPHSANRQFLNCSIPVILITPGGPCGLTVAALQTKVRVPMWSMGFGRHLLRALIQGGATMWISCDLIQKGVSTFAVRCKMTFPVVRVHQNPYLYSISGFRLSALRRQSR